MEGAAWIQSAGSLNFEKKLNQTKKIEKEICDSVDKKEIELKATIE
jgi:hypothetical protein